MPDQSPRDFDFNPYSSPDDALEDRLRGSESNDDGEADAIRRKYLNHEASVQGLGGLFCLSGGLLLAISVLFFYLFSTGKLPPAEEANDTQISGEAALFLGIFYGLIGPLYLAAGIGLRYLANWARIMGGIICIPGLLGFPIGTIFAAYFLYLLFSEKGNYVCSAEYREIIEATPHIRYRTSIIVKILIAVLLVVAFLALVGAAIVLLNPRAGR